MRRRYRSPAAADGRPRDYHARPSLYPDLYPPVERHKTSPKKHIPKCRQLSHGGAGIRSSPEHHYRAEERRNSSPTESQGSVGIRSSPEHHYRAEERRYSSPIEEVPKRSQSRQGSNVFFPNKPHHSDASWRGPPPLEETRPKASSSGEERQHGQRLLSELTAALSRDQADIAQQIREGRREQIELRQKAKLKADTFLWESNRQKKRRTELYEMTEDSAKAFRERDSMMARHAKNLVDARYLKTVTEPVLLWRPAKLRDCHEKIIRNQIEYAERTNAAEYAYFMKKYQAQMFEDVELEAGIINGDIEPPEEKPEPVVDRGNAGNRFVR